MTSSWVESVRLLTVSLSSSMSGEAKKQVLLRSATGGVKISAECVAAIKICLTRSISDTPFIINLPTVGNVTTQTQTPAVSSTPEHEPVAVNSLITTSEEDHTIQARPPSPNLRSPQNSPGSDNSRSKSSSNQSHETRATSPDTADTISDGTPFEGGVRGQRSIRGLDKNVVQGDVRPPPLAPMPEDVQGDARPPPLAPIPEDVQHPIASIFGNDYSFEDIEFEFNSGGHFVGRAMDVLVEEMTPHNTSSYLP